VVFGDGSGNIGGKVAINYLKWTNKAPVAIPGDVDGDGVVNDADIDAEYAAIAAGKTDDVYDINTDGSVNSTDVTYLVKTILKTNFGDANLDKSVDVGDLGILAANYGLASGAIWAKGDFNGDGAVDVGDLGILAANYGVGTTSGADFDADYAKVFGTTAVASEDTSDDTTGATENTMCSSLGLSLIAGLFLAGLMLVKLEE
jgi:hypothetical protein